MSRPRRFDPLAIKRARTAVADAQSAEELRCAQAILVPALVGVTLDETAALLGVGRASVSRRQAWFRQRGNRRKVWPRKWGGRRRALLTAAEEKAFLEPWAKQAKEGRMPVVSALHAAFAQSVGRPVAATVVYRMLERHGWRKVAPDTRHPKADLKAQSAWKKTPASLGRSPRRRTRKASPRASDVPRRSPLRPHGQDKTLPGPEAFQAGGSIMAMNGSSPMSTAPSVRGRANWIGRFARK